MSKTNGYDTPTLRGAEGYGGRDQFSVPATRTRRSLDEPLSRTQKSSRQSTDKLTTLQPGKARKESSWYKHHSWEEDGPKRSVSPDSNGDSTRTIPAGIDQELRSLPTSYTSSNEAIKVTGEQFRWQGPNGRRDPGHDSARIILGLYERQPQDDHRTNVGLQETGSDLGNITALPSPVREVEYGLPREEDESPEHWPDPLHRQRQTPRSQISNLAELYTLSYLILFSILGTLARLGLQWLTFYPGAPVVLGVLWANFAGSLFMGFMVEDQLLFQDYLENVSFGQTQSSRHEDSPMKNTLSKADLAKVKKTIPLYIGLATGFCGSFTSFSAFMRDVFFALSNDLPSPVNHPPQQGSMIPSTTSTLTRNAGYSFMAVAAVIILTVSLCLSALNFGAHIAISLRRFVPVLPKALLYLYLDRGAVVLGWGSWLGAILMAIWPPDRPGEPSHRQSSNDESWRGQAIFACVFAPLGCLLRYYASSKLNGLLPSFPLGTFAVNMFGTAVLGMAYDLQHVRLGGGTMSMVGGGHTACQVLQGIMDGFDGCLTTVSTWVVELITLRKRHAYLYGTSSVLLGLGLLVLIMGSVRWSIGWQAPTCVT